MQLNHLIFFVEADSVPQNITHEFMVIAESGEAQIVYCPDCDYAANVEIADCLPSNPDNKREDTIKAKEKVATPNQTTIDEVTNYLNVSADKLIKTLFYQADEEIIVALVRGDRMINEIKLQKCILLLL